MTQRLADGSAGDADYSRIGPGYALIRQPDPRIAARILDALGDARTVLNVGAGAGSYEPVDREVTAVEPSASMRAQRPEWLTLAIDATSDDLPFPDRSFDASMATVTVHQWPARATGLAEMRRVTRGPVVIMTFDPVPPQHWWLMDYAPEVFEVESHRMPAIATLKFELGGDSGAPVDVIPVPVPADCVDGFGQAFFARPERLLEADVRRAMSAWSFVSDEVVARFTGRLSADLASGAWDRQYGDFRRLDEFDAGLRLVVGHPSHRTEP
ncbi:class I SAM-dependent methyltransferase [Lacisediminihabitans sp. H27-G8]|uniref:class I SAM-dependent methyltransferase n=1 Tax=Lacisediminihabitans sp. H27-G8 TaxID=3111909 RepID=UPI0038FC5BD7